MEFKPSVPLMVPILLGHLALLALSRREVLNGVSRTSLFCVHVEAGDGESGS